MLKIWPLVLLKRRRFSIYLIFHLLYCACCIFLCRYAWHLLNVPGLCLLRQQLSIAKSNYIFNLAFRITSAAFRQTNNDEIIQLFKLIAGVFSRTIHLAFWCSGRPNNRIIQNSCEQEEKDWCMRTKWRRSISNLDCSVSYIQWRGIDSRNLFTTYYFIKVYWKNKLKFNLHTPRHCISCHQNRCCYI